MLLDVPELTGAQARFLLHGGIEARCREDIVVTVLPRVTTGLQGSMLDDMPLPERCGRIDLAEFLFDDAGRRRLRQLHRRRRRPAPRALRLALGRRVVETRGAGVNRAEDAQAPSAVLAHGIPQTFLAHRMSDAAIKALNTGREADGANGVVWPRSTPPKARTRILRESTPTWRCGCGACATCLWPIPPRGTGAGRVPPPGALPAARVEIPGHDRRHP